MATDYLQASSNVTQIIEDIHVPQQVVINTIDDNDGITLDTNTGDVTVAKKGTYMIIAAPQVGRLGNCHSVVPNFRCWLRKNGKDIANSNVLLNVNRYRTTKDVIVTQGLVDLDADDEIQVFMASNIADEVRMEAISKAGEPLIPSIIFTMFLIQPGGSSEEAKAEL